MQASPARRPSPALILALVALVVALGGTATALPGKGSVDKNDLGKKVVKKKAIANNAVTSSKVKDGQIKDADVAPAEAEHVVGAPGEPAFGTGGDGDCLWRNAISADFGDMFSGLRPVSFYKDPYDTVRLAGLAVSEDAPGGDGVCDPGDPGEGEDGAAFELPPGYRPSGLFLGISETLVVIAPDAGASFDGAPLSPGAVFSPTGAVFGDAVAFRAAGAAAASASAAGPPPEIDLDALRRLAK